MIPLDVYASYPHYLGHVQPVYDALPEKARGVVHTRRPGAHQWRFKGRAVLVASARDMRAAAATGWEHIALIEHGIGQSYGDTRSNYPGGSGRDAVGLFLSPNDHASARDQARYPDARHAVIGCPKLDTLPAREEGAGPVVAISFHAPLPGHPEQGSAWKPFRAALPALLERFTVIGHSHPFAPNQVKPEYDRLGIPFVASFDEVCRRADVYVADSSSTLYEFASTGRPVAVMDRPDWQMSHGLRFGEAADVGPRTNDPDQLVAIVERALEDPPEVRAAREAALKVVYRYRTGAAKRGAKAVREWLG